MPEITIPLNPGFALIIAALLVLGVPAGFRAGVMAAGAAGALWLLLSGEFGESGAFAQIGLEVVPRALDELNYIFGIGLVLGAMLIALYSSARRDRFEDSAILLLAGGAVSGLFAGDLLSFIAAASLAGLAAAWVVMSSSTPGAGPAGVRLLIWHGLEGLLFLAGVAFHVSAGGALPMLQDGDMNVRSLGGALVFTALMIRIGAPFAHVWLKDAVGHASSVGAPALSLFTTTLGIYALARLFPTEPLLIPIGGAMILIGAFYAVAEDDLRRGTAYALIVQTGVCVALIGAGALAAAAAHAFTSILAGALILMALGGFVLRLGATRVSALQKGAGQAMPVTSSFVVLGGLAMAGAPGLAGYASLSVALQATGAFETRAIWTLISIASAALFVALALRPALAAFRPAEKKPPFLETPFTMLLAMAVAGFFCFAIGLTPSWLYRLTPSAGLDANPFDVSRLAPQLEMLGAAGAGYVLLWVLGLAPQKPAARLLDFDSLYRGPIAGAGRWTGVVMLRLYGAWRDSLGVLARHISAGVGTWSRACDQPYKDSWAGAAQFVVISAVLAIILLAGI